MEHSRGLILWTCFFIAAAAAMNGSVEASKQFTVGDHIGWKQPSSNNSDVYTLWATSKRFHVGDSLSFEYDRNDSVLVVDKWDYYHCNSNNPIYSFNDGSNVVNLDRPGSFYFISGILDHCKNGEKLMIQVMGLHQTAEPPPATANPREVGLAPGPHPSSGIETTTIVGDGSSEYSIREFPIKNLVEAVEIRERIPKLSRGVAVFQPKQKPKLKKRNGVEDALKATKVFCLKFLAKIAQDVVFSGSCWSRYCYKGIELSNEVDCQECLGSTGVLSSKRRRKKREVDFFTWELPGSYIASVATCKDISDAVVVDINKPEPLPAGNPMDNSVMGNKLSCTLVTQ
ncbi:hypothetical protein GQ457_07G031650 [Hibiscus cannabinus]